MKAALLALPKNDFDLKKSFWLASIGIRSDGVEVFAKNQAVNIGTCNDEGLRSHQKIALSHAECRTLRKMDLGGTLFVARISKDFNENNIDFKMARPCEMCIRKIKKSKIKKVYYTINNNQYGIFFPEKDLDIIQSLTD